jgi:hypothetical protein
MYSEPTSVPEAIRRVLASNHMYLQALEAGIANYTALAEKIKLDVEKLIGSKVNLNTIVVAIKRFADVLEQNKKQLKGDEASSSVKARMSLTDSIIDIDFQREDREQGDLLEKFFEEFFEQASPYNLFQSDNHFTLMTEDADDTRKIVTNAVEKFDGKIRKGLSKITISMSPEEQNPYDMLSLVSNMLYNHQIPIHNAFFTPNEIVLILSDKDAANAYDLIRKKVG